MKPIIAQIVEARKMAKPKLNKSISVPIFLSLN